jgi:hypothetical protein
VSSEKSKGRFCGSLTEEFHFLSELFDILGEEFEFLTELFDIPIVYSNITPVSVRNTLWKQPHIGEKLWLS